MRSIAFRLQWCCYFLLLPVAVSCSLKQEVKTPTRESEFLQETSRLEKLAREDPAASVRAESHLQLAFLYVNSRNPRLNYARALQEMETFLSISSAEPPKDDFQNWFGVLKELDRVCKDNKGMEEKKQDLQSQIEKLRITLGKIQEANKNLGDEVAHLQEMIERLMILDYQMEKKRNLIK